MKLDGRTALLVEYTPIIGPLWTSGSALQALWYSFTKDKSIFSPDEETSKLIRIKGLSAIVSGLVDISLICFGLIVMAFVGDSLNKLAVNSLVYQSTLAIIVLNCLAVSIGAKLVSVQVIEFSTSQLEQVQTVGSSVVKSASITASAIEKIVVSTNHRTGLAIGAFDSFINRIIQFFVAVVSLPANTKMQFINMIDRLYRQIVEIFKLFLGALSLAKSPKNVD